MSDDEREALRQEMRGRTYRTEHRKDRRYLVRLPGPEMSDRFGDDCQIDTTDAWGYGDTEEEAYQNARLMYERKLQQAQTNPLQESFRLGEPTPAEA